MRAENTSHQIIQPPPVPESLLSTPPPHHSSLESFAQSEHQDPSQCQTPRSAGSMASNQIQDPSQCQTPRSAGSIMATSQNGEWSSAHQQKCNKKGHYTLHNAYNTDSKNSVGSIVLCNRLTRYLMNNNC